MGGEGAEKRESNWGFINLDDISNIVLLGAAPGVMTIMPSSSAVSRSRKIITTGGERIFGVEERAYTIKGDTWRISSFETLLVHIFRIFGVASIVQGAFPYLVGVAIDGAPMTDLYGLVTMCIRFMDPRTCDEVRESPQSRKFCIPFAGSWNKENQDTLVDAFQESIRIIFRLSHVGVNVDGVLVPFQVRQKPCSSPCSFSLSLSRTGL